MSEKNLATTLLKSFLIVASFLLNGVSARADILIVPDEFSTIQQAINATTAFDTVLVQPGTYYECLNMYADHTITLASTDIHGPGQAYRETILEPCSNWSEPLIEISGAEKIIFGLTLQNAAQGAIEVDGAVDIQNCYFNNNSGSDFGAVYLRWSSTAVFKNCIFAENQVQPDAGSGVRMDSGASCSIEQCTFYRNFSPTGSTIDGGFASIINSILWDRSRSVEDDEAQREVTYSNVLYPQLPGETNMSIFPQFSYPSGGDFTLRDHSPCIGAGSSLDIHPVDMSGAERPQPVLTNPDLGAHENQLGSLVIPPSRRIDVAMNGSDSTGDGSIEMPYGSLQFAVDISVDGDTVIVHPGTWAERVRIVAKNITFGSLFFITGDTSYISTTILENPNPFYSRLTLMGPGIDSTTLITGLTIQNGETYYGGGVHLEAASPRFDYVRVINNESYVSYQGNGGGGGIFMEESSPIFSNCLISGNYADDVGGGVYAKRHCSPIFINTKISNNRADAYGGGFYVKDTVGVRLERCLITGNSSVRGGGIGLNRSNLTVVHSTISDNEAESIGGGVFYRRENTSVIINSIISSNMPNNIEYASFADDYDNSVFIDYSCIDTSDSSIVTWGLAGLELGAHVVSEPPNFVDAPVNYALSLESACIDAGTSHFEYDGEIVLDSANSEYAGLHPDIGAYELWDLPAPSDFNLLAPNDGAFIDTLNFDFVWQKSECMVGDPIEYSLHLSGVPVDTTIHSGTDTTLAFTGQNYFTAGGNYSWLVSASNGIDTVYSTETGTFSIDPTVAVEEIRPMRTFLYEAYPNPFNPSTTINYELSERADVTLVVYDIAGREVTTLVNNSQPSGHYETQWNGVDHEGKKVSAGMYFASLQAGDSFQTIKMVYLR